MPPTPSATTNNAPLQNKRGLVPPDERFWKRYSPHHEFPLSSVGSFTLHALILGLLILASLTGLFQMMGLTKGDPPPIEAVTIGPGGGGGDPRGAGKGPGGKPVENVTPDPEPGPSTDVSLTSVPRVKVDPVEFPFVAQDPIGKRLIEKGNLALAANTKIQREARDRLMRGLAGQGHGGPGQDGGKDRGKDKGVGPGDGPGQKPLTARQKRVLRWVMTFDPRDGNEYVRQLDALGAIIGVPAGNDQYRIIRNLKKRPATGEIENLDKIQLIWWVDDKDYSVRSLCATLQIQPIPSHLLAFFPQKVEEDLLKMELNYRGMSEDDIQETRFLVYRSGNSYKIRVVEQIPLRR
jgi:hypothetical protein